MGPRNSADCIIGEFVVGYPADLRCSIQRALRKSLAGMRGSILGLEEYGLPLEGAILIVAEEYLSQPPLYYCE